MLTSSTERSGTRCSISIGGEVLRRSEEGDDGVETLQGSRRSVAQRGGRGRRGESFGHGHWTRGRLEVRQWRAAATGGSVVRGREPGEAMGTRGKCERGRGCCVATPGDVQAVGRQAGGAEVAGRVPARGGHARVLLARGGRRQKRLWAGPACYRAGPEVSASSYFPFPIFFSVSFVLHLCLINKNARAFL